MILSVFNDGIRWSFDFGPDSVTLTVKHLVREITRYTQKIPLPTGSLLLSQRQDFINNHLARVPISPNQEVTKGLRDEVFSSVGAQDNDKSRYRLSDLDDFEIY